MSEIKPREFWIRSSAMVDSFDREFRQAFTVPTHPDSDEIHVIEISAYRELEESLAAALSRVTKTMMRVAEWEREYLECQDLCTDYRIKIKDLQAKLKEYEDQGLLVYGRKIELLAKSNRELEAKLKDACEALEYFKQQTKMYYDKTVDLEAKLNDAVNALEYTQRTDVIIGHDEMSEDGKLRGMPDKIMMRNKCAQALARIKEVKP